ncbi:alanine racemase [Granulicella sp. 5B5]|uniref:alanine racemase n=1 Tax=Granulicella sp. 5B5 TaxID=1617967 RepID=UPI0015F5DE7F|nr:alanine racemase [Granulicella sp. 5B5]QMV18732.1 alanine racemase [Granulicella sp. 5B5]
MKSWIEISSTKLVENLRAVQSVAGTSVETLAVVKANGYGHDATVIAPVLESGGARWLGVTDVEEGARVRQILGHGGTRILVMCGMDLSDAPQIVAHGLTPIVWTPEHIGAMERAARGVGHRASVHLEIDTGMSRQGIAIGTELDKVLERLAASRWVSCEGVMTHLACAESAPGTPGSAVTAAQRKRFAAALEQVTAAGIKPELIHMGNTSAVDEGSTMKWIRDAAKKLGARAMVRTGLGLYGDTLSLEGEATAALHPRLSPVLTWKTRIIGLRDIPAGATVGYGATFTAQKPMRLALLPVGYADGFRREASSGVGNGWVMLAGRQAKVIGRVSMNLTVVDITGRKNIAMGDEVVLLGEGVTADDHARWCHTIPYEILCGLRGHVHLA